MKIFLHGRHSSIEDLNKFLNAIDWDHAFLREQYVLSPSYLAREEPSQQIAPDVLPDAKLLIITPAGNSGGIEFYLHQVSRSQVRFDIDLFPKLQRVHDRFQLIMNPGIPDAMIVARSIKCKERRVEESWGWSPQYGIENLFNKSGFPLEEDLYD